jgi:hypothetical protein
LEWVRAWKGDGMNRDLFAAAGGAADATTDPYFNSTTLLLSGDGTNGAQNNTFVDSSVNNATITRAGTPTQGSFSPFSQTGWSGYFNGSSYLVGPTGNATLNAALDILGGDFTIEFWYNPTTTNADVAILTNFTASGVNGWVIGTRLGGFNINTWTSNTSAEKLSTSVGINAGIWCHVALVKLSGNLYFYVNGTEIGMYSGYTRTATANPGAGTGLGIGAYIQNLSYPSYISGYLSNIRVVKGVAVYTGNFTPPTAPLTAIQAAGTNIAAITGTATSLLTLQDNRFKDNSTNNFTITAAGTPSVQAFSPLAPTAAYSLPAAAAGSAYFNGTSNYLSVSASSTWAYGTGDFTIECWAYIPNFNSRGTFLSNRATASSSTDWVLQWYASKVYFGTSANDLIISSSNLIANIWNHITVTRSSGTLRLFVNGMSDATPVTGNTTNFSAIQALKIGNQDTGSIYSYYYTGYLSNVRIVKGTAVYTGNFTPSGTPLSKIQSAGTNIAALSGTETSLLTLQDSTFKDNSVNVATITASSPAPVIQSFTPFTQVWGGYFDGSGYSALTMSNTTSLAMGTGNFTIEFWINTSNIAQTGYVLQTDTGANTLYISLSGSTIRLTNQSTPFAVTPTLLSNTWYHIAAVRSGTSSVIYTNGVAGTAVTCSIDFTQAGPSIGNNSFIGYISNFRVVKGVAVYTGAFTPPAKTLSATQAAGTNISAIYPGQTSLLTLQDPTFKDNATLPNTITAAGTPKAQLVSAPFTSAATVDPVNGAGYFDGSSYLSVPPTSNFAFGTGDFTVECYIYGNSTTFASGAIFSPNVWNGGSLYWAILANGGNVTWQSSHGNTNLFSISAVAYYNTWLHITVVRSSGTTKMYFNGVQVASAADSNNYVLTTTYVIARNGDGPYNMGAGYLSNLRIVKGTAVYTAAFQPPTAPLTAITNTSLLTLQDTTFKDNSTNALAITVAGSPSIRAFTPFASNWGGSFNGTSDYLTSALGPNLLGAGNFCVEIWAYPTVFQTGSIIGNATNLSGGSSNWELFYSTAANLRFTSWYTNFITSSQQLILNAWNHIVVCRTGTTLSMFQNGIRTGTITNSTNFNVAAAVLVGYGSSGYFPGYLSNARVVIGAHPYDATLITLTVPSAPLTAITNTSLLTLQNNTFIDNSTNALAITATGAPKTQLLQLPFTSSITKVPAPWNISVTAPLATVGGGMYFDGSSNLELPNSTASALSTGDFTIESWVYPIAIGTAAGESHFPIVGTMGSFSPNVTVNWLFEYTTAGGNHLRLVSYEANTGYTIDSNTVTLAFNTWSHVACVRVSGIVTFYINGINQGGGSHTRNLGTTLGVYVGVMYGGGPTAYTVVWRSTMYASNLRVVKGTAVYTGNFTPPAAPPQPTQTPGLLGTNVNAIDGTNTSLLLLGSNAGIYDATAKNDIITVGNAQVSSTQIKYGTGAMYFDGTGDWLQSPSSSQTLAFATGDFTVECWVNFATNNGTYNPFVRYDGSGTFDFGYDYSVAQIKYNGSGAIFAISQTFTVGTWYHVALTRASGSSRLFVNGTQVGSTATGDTNNYASGAFKVGGSSYSGSHVMSGYIDDLRITKAARYTTNFTPPTKAMIGQ